MPPDPGWGARPGTVTRAKPWPGQLSHVDTPVPSAVTGQGFDHPMEELFKTWTAWVAVGVEAAAAGIIALTTVEATWQAVRVFVVRPAMPDAAKEGVRLRLARWLAVALEFALAADILRTAIAPSWDEIGKLAAIAALCTLLNFFLQREIVDEAARRRRGDTPAEHAPMAR